ncbi:putative mercuric transport protein [Anoxynatronum sibiricum]|uniref:putative mercuric transport protein n=1 Tax=Anoxynatronum sibiricum TaxID=210623 RepID=UPI0031B8245E
MIPLIIVSLGLSGIGLSYVAILAPYQRIFQVFAIVMLMWAHYRMEKQVMSRRRVMFIWAATVMVMILTVSPLLTRLLF